jgi:hypothetical protein
VPITRVEYKGMTLYAAAFEVVQLHRFISTLSIELAGGAEPGDNARLLSPPCPNELFADEHEALASAITFGQAVIDGEIAGLTVDDFNAI